MEQVCVQLCTLTAWHCPHSPAAAAAVGRAHSSKHAASGLLLWGMLGQSGRQTDVQTDSRIDGRTPYRFIDPAAQAYYESSANK